MKTTLLISCVLITVCASGQDMSYTKKVIDTLTSAYFWGRGYTNDGMKKAAKYVADEMRAAGLKPMNKKSYLQTFSYPVNTFPGKMEVVINGRTLVPTIDYLIYPASRGIKAFAELVQKDSLTFINTENRIIVSLADRLTWSGSNEAHDYTAIELQKMTLTDHPTSIRLDVENKFIKSFTAMNVAGMVKGTRCPDSVILITAHYDHLGGMGVDNYFPGANDNVSGTAMLLNLARHYAANPAPYTIAFIAFAGEEMQLGGSRYFTDHPLINLDKTRFVINLDLLGTGEEGITVVNALEHRQEYNKLVELNRQSNLLPAVHPRGNAANSDHYPFTQKGVPAFFIYTLGGSKTYHGIYDVPSALSFACYAGLYKLILHFNEWLMN